MEPTAAILFLLQLRR